MTGGAAGAGETRTPVILHSPVPIELADEVERRLLFVSPDITGYELDTSGGEVRGVTLLSDAPLTADAVTEKVNYVVDRDVRRQLVAPSRAVWSSPHTPRFREAVYDQLVAAGAVSEAGEGQVALGEPLLSLLAFFDRTVLEVLAEDFDATEWRYPTLISTETLGRAGYFTSFPQHLFLVTRLRNDIDVYRAFQASDPGPGLDQEVLGLTGNLDYCLPPTMCYHTFHQHQGRTLASDRLHVVTARGKSFRYEAGYATTLERLWDFTVREIVFLGSRADVLHARETFMHKVFALADELELAGSCEVANDPFFCGPDAAERIWSQRLMGLKYELRLPVATNRDIAVASFNFHDDLFGRVFGIQHGDAGAIRSGCAGFGLERLTYAFLCQHGLDRARWPDRVRNGVPGEGGLT